jgi:hypothetical protein
MNKHKIFSIRRAQADDVKMMIHIELLNWQEYYADLPLEYQSPSYLSRISPQHWKKIILELKVLVLELHEEFVGFTSFSSFEEFPVDDLLLK